MRSSSFGHPAPFASPAANSDATAPSIPNMGTTRLKAERGLRTSLTAAFICIPSPSPSSSSKNQFRSRKTPDSLSEGPFLTLTISHQITLAAVLPSLLPSLLTAVLLTSHCGTAFTSVLPSLLTTMLHY